MKRWVSLEGRICGTAKIRHETDTKLRKRDEWFANISYR